MAFLKRSRLRKPQTLAYIEQYGVPRFLGELQAAAVYFCFPTVGLQGISLAVARPEKFVWAGAGLICVSALLASHLWA